MIVGRPAAPARITVVHHRAEGAEEAARILRPAGHRVVLLGPGPELARQVVESGPDLLVGAARLPEPPLGSLVRAVRQTMGDLPVLVLLDGLPDALIEADALVREPLVAGELDLTASLLLRTRQELATTKRRMQELSGLYRISWAFALETGPEPLFEHLSRESAHLVRAARAVVFLYDAARREMVAQHRAHGFTREQVDGLRIATEGERQRWNFRLNGPLLSNRAGTDTRLAPGLADALRLESVLAVPMVRAAQVLGVLAVCDRPRPFTEDDLNLLRAVADEAAVAVENLRLHEELKAANLLLKEYDRLKSEFLAIIAHDLRRPLTAIRGFTELLADEPGLDAETRRDYTHTILSESDTLARLADDALLVTNMERDGFEFDWSAGVDLGGLLMDVAPLGLSDHTLHMSIPPSLPRIVADRTRLRQVFTNLLSNALKYSPGGGVIAVTVSERPTGHLLVEVADQGLGIPPEQLSRLFGKFQRVRTEQHLAISGTGLGLHICKLVVDGHEGQISVESRPGAGSTFRVLLPVEGPRAAATAVQDHPAAQQAEP